LRLFEKATELHCDLIVLDLLMPLLNGVEAASIIRRMVPEAKIVGMTMFGDEFDARGARVERLRCSPLEERRTGEARRSRHVNFWIIPPETR